MWYAVLTACVVDGIGSGVLVEFDGIVWALVEVAYKPDSESTEVDIAGINAGFCKFANCKEDVGLAVVGKVEERTHSGAEG